MVDNNQNLWLISREERQTYYKKLEMETDWRHTNKTKYEYKLLNKH